MKHITTIQVPQPVGGYKCLVLALTTPSGEDNNPDAFLDIQVYERTASDADLEDLEFVGTVACICQNKKDPNHKLYIRAYKDTTGFVGEEVFIATSKGYPAVLGSVGDEKYSSDDIDKDSQDYMPDPLAIEESL